MWFVYLQNEVSPGKRKLCFNAAFKTHLLDILSRIISKFVKLSLHHAITISCFSHLKNTCFVFQQKCSHCSNASVIIIEKPHCYSMSLTFSSTLPIIGELNAICQIILLNYFVCQFNMDNTDKYYNTQFLQPPPLLNTNLGTENRLL